MSRTLFVIMVLLSAIALSCTVTYLLVHKSPEGTVVAETKKGDLEAKLEARMVNQSRDAAVVAETKKGDLEAKLEARMAEVETLAKNANEVAQVVVALRTKYIPAPANNTLAEHVRWLRENADIIDRIDASRCPSDVQAALQQVTFSIRKYAIFLEQTPESFKKEGVDLAYLFTGSCEIVGAAVTVVGTASKVGQIELANLDEWQQLKTAVTHLRQVVTQYGGRLQRNAKSIRTIVLRKKSSLYIRLYSPPRLPRNRLIIRRCETERSPVVELSLVI